MSLIAVDVETTGIDHKVNSILSVGAVSLRDPERRFYGECRAWEGAVIEDKALEVNGFSREEATDPAKPTEGQLIAEFLRWVHGTENNPVMVGHNVSFDRDFVRSACERAGKRSPFSYRTVDTHSIGYLALMKDGLNPPANLSLNKLLMGIGAGREPEPHNALTGAMCAAEIFSRLLTKKSLFPGEFSDAGTLPAGEVMK